MQNKQPSSIILWVISLIIVIGLHISLAVALMFSWHAAPPPPLTAPAAIMVELAPSIEAPNNTPQKDPAPITQQISDPTPEEPDPIDEPDPLPEPIIEKPDPKVVINKQPKPKPIKKPVKKPIEKPIEKPKEITEDTLPKAEISSTASAVSDRISDRVAAPETTASTSPSKAQITWQSRLFAHIAKYKRYPMMARKKRQQGTVSVNFTIDTQGNLSAKRIVKSSGYPLLDQEVLNLLDRAQPLPKPPADVLNGKNARTITIPINFNLKDRY